MKRLLTVILLISLLALSACLPHGGEPSSSAAPTVSTEASSLPTAYYEAYCPGTDYDDRFAQLYNGFVETENSYYWLSAENAYLYYVEKDGSFSGPLCGKPDCMHSDASCSANTHKYVPGLSLYDGKLYFIAADGSDPKHVCSLQRMDLDGTNRERLFYIDNSKYAIQKFWVHRGMLFAAAYTSIVENGAPYTDLCLLCGSLEGEGIAPVIEKKYPSSVCGWPMYTAVFYGEKALFGISFSDPDTSTATNAVYEYDIAAGHAEERVCAVGCEFQMCGLYMDDTGDIFVSSYGMCWDRQTAPAVYRLNNGGFEKLFDYADGDEFSRAVLFNDLAVGILADTSIHGADTVWIRRLDGSTVARGKLTRSFLDGHDRLTNGGYDIAADEEHIYCFYSGWLKDEPLYSFFVRYDISEDGISEQLLAEY